MAVTGVGIMQRVFLTFEHSRFPPSPPTHPSMSTGRIAHPCSKKGPREKEREANRHIIGPLRSSAAWETVILLLWTDNNIYLFLKEGGKRKRRRWRKGNYFNHPEPPGRIKKKKRNRKRRDDGSGSESIIQESSFLVLFSYHSSTKASPSVPRSSPPPSSSSPLDKCYCVPPATKAMWFVVDFTSGSIPYSASSICQQHRHLHSV
ncbi:hypothetical protein M747DRAFT_87874 [Aspergillus niger ATCC 13496]|uniref:Uncharacterized protein n=1 Tax=Aspergillus niger ATCC 13496 TaxID=1353008 RepID=A0A370CBR6_ASPNG|nr:hypothetical protein M747DRAFT_87874 [Aspergillus niger ATCC 13496]